MEGAPRPLVPLRTSADGEPAPQPEEPAEDYLPLTYAASSEAYAEVAARDAALPALSSSSGSQRTASDGARRLPSHTPSSITELSLSNN